MRSLILALIVGLIFGIGARPVPAATAPSFDYDRSAPLDVRIAKSWQEGSATFEDLTFAAPAGRVHAELVMPTEEKKTGPCVLFVHWLGDPKTTNLTEFLPDARALSAKGVTSLLVDAMWAQPGWFDTLRRPDTDFDDSVRQVIALRRALDVLQAQPHVDATRIAYVGHDFGSMYGAILSAVDPRPTCYVLMAGVPTLSEWFLLGVQPKDKAAYVDRMSALDPIKYLARSKARSFMFQDALKDSYVPVREAEAFAEAAPGERASFFYASDHALAAPQITDDRLQWLTARLLGRKAMERG